MRSVRLHAPGDLQIHDEPLPVPGEGEGLIRVRAVGLCGSDLHWFSEGAIGDAVLNEPLVLGHEFAGETSEGERVAVDPSIPCGTCRYCNAGHPNLCASLHFAGHGGTDGGLREYMAWPAKCLFPIPDSMDAAEAAMLEPLGVAIHALDLSHMKMGMTVGVFGCGPIGLLIIQLAKRSGAAEVIATDKLFHRVEAAKGLGADHAIWVADSQTDGQTRAETSSRGVDLAFEAAGDQGAVEDAFDAVLPGGMVVLVGIPQDDHTTFSASTARRKGLTIKLVRRMKHTYPRAIELVAGRRVDVRSLVTHHFPLERSAEAFRFAVKREGIKTIIDL